MKIIKLPLLQTLDYLEKIQKEAKNLQKLEVRWQTGQTKRARRTDRLLDRWTRINKLDGWMDEDRKSTRNSGGYRVNDGTQTETRSLFTQLRSGPKRGFRQGNAAVWLSIHCWEKSRCYERGENGPNSRSPTQEQPARHQQTSCPRAR